MAIQFPCPSCGQPIEVDDEWAAKHVACPYCGKTVTAPESSTVGVGRPSSVVPTASPGPEAAPVGSDPAGATDARRVLSPSAFAATFEKPRTSNPYAPWALALSCTAAVLYFSLNVFVAVKLEALVGPGATIEESQQALFESIEAGNVPGWFVAVGLGFLLTVLVWVAALILCILAVRRPGRRGMTIAGFVVCAIIPVFVCLGAFIGIT